MKALVLMKFKPKFQKSKKSWLFANYEILPYYAGIYLYGIIPFWKA